MRFAAFIMFMALTSSRAADEGWIRLDVQNADFSSPGGDASTMYRYEADGWERRLAGQRGLFAWAGRS